MIEKKWVFAPKPLTETTASLSEALGVAAPVATVLAQRGINDFLEAKDFFRPNLELLHDPLLMADMPKAVERVRKAIDTNQKIMVYGDYDVDGTTAVSLMVHFLKKIANPSNVSFYIPDRYKEGYGLQQPGIDHAKAQGVSLMITLDCGIKSVDKVAYANRLGVDVIICDHHTPGAILPDAVAVLDPKRTDCGYPFKELTGCGVGFKLLTALAPFYGISPTETLEYLDLVATSTSCDIVPVNGENRVLCYYGLQKINAGQRVGIQALKKSTGMEKLFTITDVVFSLGPRINAAGRINHANDAVDLLLCEDPLLAQDFAATIGGHNLDRKELDSSITEHALAKIAENDLVLGTKKTTVLYDPTWHKGVIGIVASRCIERYHRPTIIFTESNGKAAGSARSVPGFDLYTALEACSEHLIQFGGHMFAAGMTIETDKIPAFAEAFEAQVSATIKPHQLYPTINCDLEIDLADIDNKFVNIINQMAPFGPANMTPNFVSRGLKLLKDPFIMKEKHLKLEVYQLDTKKSFTAVGFGMVGEFHEKLISAPSFDMCYQVDFNEFRGQKSIQLMIKDIKFAD
jgi:single-stranded-DNA-specific exonuclease